MRSSALSDYERGRRTPELKTLEKLVGAMGYPLSAVAQTRTFIHALRAQALLSDVSGEGAGAFPGAMAPAAAGATPVAVPPGLSLDSPAALQWEIEQVTAEAGRVAARMAQLFLLLIHRAAAGARQPPAGDPGYPLRNELRNEAE